MKLKETESRSIAYLAIFVLATFTLALKIIEVSAYQSLKLIVLNPDISSYSQLVQDGYLFDK